MTGFGCTIHNVIMNVTNRNRSLMKSEIRHYFIRLTIYIKMYQNGSSHEINGICNVVVCVKMSPFHEINGRGCHQNSHEINESTIILE